MTARMPQRFRWKTQNDGDWKYGVVLPGGKVWHIRAGHGHGSFMDDPWEIMGHIIGDIAEFEWIDNDCGWTGDMMPLVGGTDMIRLAEIRKQIHDRYVCWNEVAHEIAKDLLAEVDRLRITNNWLQSIASNGWIEAWHCGNGFMALPPDDDHGTVSRCWSESQTLKAIQKINSR
jgi:hypothetical protein